MQTEGLHANRPWRIRQAHIEYPHAAALAGAKRSYETALEEQRVVHAKVDQGTLAPVEKHVDAAVVQAQRQQLLAEDQTHNTERLLLIGRLRHPLR